MIVLVLLVVATVANTVLLALIFREARRGRDKLSPRSAGQPVAGSSKGQSVAAAAGSTAIAAADLPARPRTREEQAEYDAIELNRIKAKLAKDMPNLGTTKREAVALEIQAKARNLLARAP